MRLEGTYSLSLENQIINELQNMGFKNVSISATRKSGGTDLIINDYVYRDIDNPDDSRMKLIIEAEPNFRPFIMGRFLGVNEGDDFKFVVKGEALSEKSYLEIEGNP